MRCGHCKQLGHNRSTCESFKASEAICSRTKYTDRGTICRCVGWNEDCPCSSCKKYRDLNLPTPEIAVPRAAQKHIRDQYPVVKITNNTNTSVYLYNNNETHPELLITLSKDDTFTINNDTNEYGPFDKDEDFTNLLVSDRYLGETVPYRHIPPQYILKFITINYGAHQDIVIVKKVSDSDKWRTAALKSRFLLIEMERLGAKNNPNLEPIIDLLQDIDFPECDEVAKEQSGIPSQLTNITFVFISFLFIF